jgi:hypothetical protein
MLYLRLKRLTELHERLYQRQRHPLNYGILTGIFAFMMQSVLFTPPEINTYVRESLNLLCFRETVERFGMFFLHDLDITLNDCLPEILKMDDADVYRSLKISPHRTRRIRLRDARNEPEVEVDGDQYPIGPTPTWAELEKAMENEPWSILRRWEWPEELDELARPDAYDNNISMAIDLFQSFTSQIWAILHPVWKTSTADTAPFQPRNLKEALEFWTLDQLHKRLVSYVLQPCNAGLRGDIPGQRMQPFNERWRLYMDPDASSAMGARWDTLREPYGLIGRYQNALKKLSPIDRDNLYTTLETLFSYCQCLPRTSQKGVWAIDGEKVILLANPTYYKINAIRAGRSGRRKPTHTSKTVFQSMLIQLAGYTSNIAARAVAVKRMLHKAVEARKQSNSKRSGKARNRRAPPVKKGKATSDSITGCNPEH